MVMERSPQRAQMTIIEGGFGWERVHELMQAGARVKAGGKFGSLGRGSDPAWAEEDDQRVHVHKLTAGVSKALIHGEVLSYRRQNNYS